MEIPSFPRAPSLSSPWVLNEMLGKCEHDERKARVELITAKSAYMRSVGKATTTAERTRLVEKFTSSRERYADALAVYIEVLKSMNPADMNTETKSKLSKAMQSHKRFFDVYEKI